jgi:beta-lactamase class A
MTYGRNEVQLRLMFPIEKYIAQFSGKDISLSVHDLETGREINLRADESYHPASTVKVHLMMEVFRQAHTGQFSLDDSLTIFNSFPSIADGSPYSLEAKDDSETSLYERIGETESIRELTRLMIVRSSNLATNILFQKIGARAINEFLAELGIQDVAFVRGMYDLLALKRGMNNRGAARGLTQTMRLIAEGKAASKQASEEMIEIMLGQEFNESIPGLLPKGTQVAHKTGWSDDFYHDTGIVFPVNRKPYAISIMTRGFAEDQADEAHDCMANISKLVYEQLI